MYVHVQVPSYSYNAKLVRSMALLCMIYPKAMTLRENLTSWRYYCGRPIWETVIFLGRKDCFER